LLFLCFVLQQDLPHWQTVFFISAAVYAAGNTFFLIFGTGVEQSWNKIEDAGNFVPAESVVDGVPRVVGEAPAGIF
jgi:hypothetical protein